MSSICHNKLLIVYMVYYFHTIYARDDLKYLVKVYPNYELYDGCPLRENDVLVVAVYLNCLHG